MELNIRIDLSGTRWLRRTLLLAVPVGAMAITSVAVGAPPKTFTSGELLKAADLNANFADVDGKVAAIDGRVDSLEGAVEPPSGFKARRTTAPSIAGGTPTHLNYETEEFDYADEYNPATGMFTVKAAGVYAIQCASHVTAPGVGGILSSFIVKNGAELFGTDEANGGTYQTEVAATIAPLAMGDVIECQFFHTTNANVVLTSGPRAHFSAIRVGPAP